MRVRSIGSVAILAVLGMATTTSGAGGSRTAIKKIPLPPPNSVQVSEVTVTVTAPKGKSVGALKLSVKNQKELGSAANNTQVVTAMSPKSSKQRRATFKVWIFVHRFEPVTR